MTADEFMPREPHTPHAIGTAQPITNTSSVVTVSSIATLSSTATSPSITTVSSIATSAPPIVRPLPFTAPRLLAPMEGVTEPCFRDLVLSENSSEHLGGAFTEFARVVREPLSKRALREHLGERRFDAPVGLQLMGSDLESLAITAARAAEIGAPLVDLNFGCPAKGAIRTCAGSALLREPVAIERIVRACAEAAGGSPVTAKIRAGYDDASLVEELALAAEAGGAAMLTVHCRTRVEAFQDDVDWSRVARAVSAVTIPVCGNGGIDSH
ncbi:MAG TPA: tRNA-dihydrouridine synthase family protein, partial [Polyangiaceae bacterium]